MSTSSLEIGAVTDWKRRLLDEKAELVAKRERLAAFLNTDTFANVPENKKELLKRQHQIMGQYVGILIERIHAEGL